MAKRGNFFIRLCYGYVGRNKDTSKMSTKEVIEEFLKSKGVSTPGEFFQKRFSGIRQSGAISGASSGAVDSASPRGIEHAEREYVAIRKNKYDIENIAKNTGFTLEQIKSIKNYVFFQHHTFRTRAPGRFDADKDMAESWKRLNSGKNIWKADIIMLKHELYEMSIRHKYAFHEDAHEEAEKVYNYKEAIEKEREERYGKNRKYKN